MLLLFSVRVTFRKELFIRFTVLVFRKPFLVSAFFRFGVEGGVPGLIVLVPDHSLSFYF